MQAYVDDLGRRISALVSTLTGLGYQFDRPDDVFPGPEPDAPEAIHRLERAVGPLPLALKLFWLRIGSVDLSGHHPEWQEPGYLDQLVIFPLSYALEELDEYLSDKEERDLYSYPYTVPIAPDYFHKANVSGGMSYSIAVPAVAEDPPLLHTSEAETFLEHISKALKFGGFPGLADCPGHSWPLSSLTQSDA